MGKEWLMYWVGGNGGSAAAKSTKKRKSGGGSTELREATSPGCMCSVFQLFDLHHFQFPLNHNNNNTTLNSESFLHFQDHDEPSAVTTKGVEAPRNSLELVETAASSSSCLPSSAIINKEEQFLNIPVGIQIKTSCDLNRSPRASTSSSKARGDHQDLFSEYCSSGGGSPGAKTPNLVARLMGLDLLPETGSPSLSSSSRRSSVTNSTLMHQFPSRHTLKQDNPRSRPFLQSRPCSRINNFYDNIDIGGGSVSLPETPRISSASRRSDVEHSRLSLQMNREPHVGGEEFGCLGYGAVNKKTGGSWRTDVTRVVQDENRSPASGRYHARNIVQQVKERVRSRSRKVGLDITNTIKGGEERSDDQHMVLLKQPKKKSLVLTNTRSEDDRCSPSSKQTTPSCSPRLRLLMLDTKNKAITSCSNTPIVGKAQSPALSSSLSADNQSQVQESNVTCQKLIRPQVPLTVVDQQQQQHTKPSVQKCKKSGKDRLINNCRITTNPPPPTASDAIRNKKEEPFIRPTTTNKLALSVSEKKKKSSSKKTPLSNELLPVSRKDSCLTLTNKLQENQVSYALPWEGSSTTTATTRLSSFASRSYYSEVMTHATTTTTLGFQENIRDKGGDDMCNGASSSSSVDETGMLIHDYLKRILKRSGLDSATPVTLAKWFSPSHPLDPSIFHYMELFHPKVPAARVLLSHRSNRKLLFQLVDELLVEILKPYIIPNPWMISSSSSRQRMLYGSELTEQVCNRIKNFPSANCEVLEDIDALIEADLRKSRLSEEEEEEKEEVGERIASEIMEWLVHETWSMMMLW